MKKQNMIHLIFGIIILLLLVTLISYAYFSANIVGAETDTTISVSGGTLDIYYVGGSNITKSNISPSDTPFADKEFTIKGNNTIGKSMYYNLSLIIKTNTFTDYGISYNLSLKSKTGNGTPVPESEEDMCYILNGPQTETLGSGLFPGPTNGEEIHTYSLKMYFPDKGNPQNEDKGKTFAAYIKTEEGEKTASKCKQAPPSGIGGIILVNNGWNEGITEAPTLLFNSPNTSSENKMYKMEDDYGDSYYFRGAQSYVNNNLIFAEHQWKIIRINGDGSLRIIYNGECPGNSCTINETGTGTHMKLPSSNGLYNSSGNTAYNPSPYYNDAKYVGYMYGGANGEASTSREGATTNETSTNIKTYLDSWYEVNIKGKSYEKYIADTLFCNDREIDTGYETGLGYAKNKTGYMALYRLFTNKTPSIKCNNQNDRFTTANYDNEIVPGNNALNYPIGLLTADEGALAGLKAGSSNSTNYLYTNQNFWTMSPCRFSGSYAYVWYVYSDGGLYDGYNSVVDAGGARGVLNLASNTPITGVGTASEPYVLD